jgi:DNA polymerase III subunit gamma/tau
VPAQALYLRWRPRTFADVIGQEHITRTLQNALVGDRIRHAYLFNGPRGTGKTTLARILAKAVNCLDPNPAHRPCDVCSSCVAVNEGRFLDLIEIDAASHNGVEDVRDLRDKIQFAPSEGRFKVYVFDEVHRFSPAAFDALLKTLEEPPDHAIFILATTELNKVPATIKSRSLTFEFRRVSLKEVADRLGRIAAEEGVQIERRVLELVAQLGTGSVRDSISLLDQLIADPTQAITYDYAERVLGTAAGRAVNRIAQAILDGDAAAGLDGINQALEDGADPGQLGRQMVEYLRNLMIIQTGGAAILDVSEDVRKALEQQAHAFPVGHLIRSVRAFNSALSEMRGGALPQLPLELAVVESIRAVQEPVVYASAPARKQSPQPAQQAAPYTPPEADATAEISSEPPNVATTEMMKAWSTIVQRIRDGGDKPLASLLEYTEVKSIEGDVLTLIMKQGSLRGKLEDQKNRDKLNDVIRRIFKRKFQIRVVVADTITSAQVDDRISKDPLLNGLVQDGGVITRIEDTGGGL